MTIPLWAWNRDKEKYELVPIKYLKQYPDGKWGMEWPVMTSQQTPRELRDWFQSAYHYFTLECNQQRRPIRYVLKSKEERE